MDEIYMWETLVPTVRNEGRPYRTRYHRVWDKRVREISGGLTITPPVKGTWLSDSGDLYMERMIPVRIACTSHEIEAIAEFTKSYYNQLKVLYYCVSTTVRFV